MALPSWNLVLGGLLAIPSLLIHVMIAPLLMMCSIPSLLLLVFRKRIKGAVVQPSQPQSTSTAATKKKSSSSIHVIVTGGSSGIGLGVAQECLSDPHVGRITLLARNQTKLQEAKALLQQQQQQQATTTTTSQSPMMIKQPTAIIDVVSCDVTNPQDLDKAVKEMFPPNSTTTNNNNNSNKTLLFCCAGAATPGYFHKLTPADLQGMVQLNLMGTMYAVHAFLPHMTTSGGGVISMTSSMAGQLGIVGYAGYAPTKRALSAFAEALHMELLTTDIHVQVVYPPDTDTPGYVQENKLKPKECFLISESGGALQSARNVAKTMVREAMRKNPKFSVYFGLEGWMLATLTAGMSPESSLLDAACQVTLNGLLRHISFFYYNDFWNTLWQCRNDEKKD